MSKTLTWFLSGQVAEGTAQGPAFRLDADYRVTRIWMSAKTGPSGSNLIVDINQDGTSLFASHTTNPCIVKGNTEMDDHDISYTLGHLSDGGVVTLDVDAAGNGEPGRDLTVQIDLDEVSN